MKITALCLILTLAAGCSDANKQTVSSPDKSIAVSLLVDADTGGAYYTLAKDGKQLLLASKLGVKMGHTDFTRNLTLDAVSDTEVVQDNYQMLTGKRRDISYTANRVVFSFVNADQQKLDIVFQVSNDGVAFRYLFAGDSDDVKRVDEEITSFAFDGDATAWLQPIAEAQTGWANTNPSYEEHYQMQIPVGTESPSPAGWVFPALFKTQETWLLITEAGMDGRYHASRLKPESPGGEYSLGTPMAAEVYPGGALLAQSALPFKSPWRIITVGPLATIVESTLGTDVAEPAIDMDMSFVKPGLASWSWALLKDESITYDIQKQFIDYAADMNWQYTLIDVNWDTTIGYEKIQELANYAAKKNVGLILWYNSSGSWNETEYHPKSKLLTHEDRVAEFSRIRDMGIKGVKVDFFAGDGKSMMQYYNEMIADAADHELLVNFHGSSLPRGLQRTYPNLMTMEAVKGFEFVTFFQENADLAASHSAMLPFTRNVFDPMDYTPTTFSDIPNIERKTTNGFELAQPVIFLSGIQHIAETPKGMATVPDYVKNYMRQIPAMWDDSKFVQGFPGKLAVIARRAGNAWYVSAINGENIEKDLVLDLSFIGSRNGYLINDSGDLSGVKQSSAKQSSFTRRSIVAGKEVKVNLEGNGGFAMVFE